MFGHRIIPSSQKLQVTGVEQISQSLTLAKTRKAVRISHCIIWPIFLLLSEPFH